LGFEDPVSETDNQVVEREKSVGEHDTLARLHEGEENVVEKAEDEITEVEVTNSDAEEISLLLLIVGDVEFVLDGALKSDHGGVSHENRESREDGAFVQDVGTIVVLERSFGFIFSRRIGIGLFRILCGRRNQRTIFSIKIVISIFISVNTVVTGRVVVSFAVEVAIAASEGAAAVRFAERNTITFLLSSSFHAMVVHRTIMTLARLTTRRIVETSFDLSRVLFVIVGALRSWIVQRSRNNDSWLIITMLIATTISGGVSTNRGSIGRGRRIH
jgi:hypothetical protein